MSRTTAERLDAERLIRDPETALGVIATPDGSPLGIAAYFGLDRAQDRAELRVMVGEASLRADELLEEAVRLWVRYGIEELGLRKIVASLLGADLLGVRVHQRLGFDLEGVFRDEVALDDGFHDVVRMALLSPPQV
ncbi:MAG: GNAT family protein [Myxococcota bacterium]